MQKLLNFDVVIEPLDDQYRTRVISSPVGEAAADFALPFTDKDLELLILKVIGSIGRVRRKARRIESKERQLLETFGGQLYQAAFSGRVSECLDRSLLAAESKNAGLRIRLRLPGALANIPWEYLYDKEYGFLGLSPETALVRYVEMPKPVRPFPIRPPLRILTMISAPSDIPALQGEEEWGKLNNALDDLIRQEMVQVDRLEVGTLSALQRPLRLHRYHVLHFVGHGGYDENAQDGALALEGIDRKTRLVTGRDLGQMIRGHRSLRLVVLNACEGARSARDDPFGGVAQALVRQGIPGVIAMQFEISDPAALVFSQSFYQAIADGLSVDVAMVESRRAMFAAGSEVEWGTPVLYLRSPDGRVFARGQVREPKHKAPEEPGPKYLEESELSVKEKRARSTGEAGDAAGARDQFAALLPVRERVLGPEHPETLETRHDLARWTGEAGDAAGARDQFAALLPVRERVLGPEHPETLETRHDLARWTGEAGDAAGARDQFAALLPVRERVLGPEHPETLETRHDLARWTGEAGDAAGARDQFAALLPLVERVLSRQDPLVKTIRRNLTLWTDKADGDPRSGVE